MRIAGQKKAKRRVKPCGVLLWRFENATLALFRNFLSLHCKIAVRLCGRLPRQRSCIFAGYFIFISFSTLGAATSATAMQMAASIRTKEL